MEPKRKGKRSQPSVPELKKKQRVEDTEKNSQLANRVLDVSGLIVHETLPQVQARVWSTPAKEQWEIVGVRPHYGINVPVFSLKTRDSLGVGGYLDLLPLVDWCCQVGFHIIQLLPLNQTHHNDFSPFSPVSSFSLNPLLMSLKKLPYLDLQTQEMKDMITSLEKYNDMDRVHWTEVVALKWKWLKDFSGVAKEKIMAEKEFTEFVEQNKLWLEGFALFCALKEKNAQMKWEDWPEEESSLLPSSDLYGVLLDKHKDEITFHNIMQYLCWKQMREAKEYANSKGVLLKGDIPFAVSRDSADVWLNKTLFNFDYTAGAPPDVYSAEGQDWGLPLYNWSEIEYQDYKWWVSRVHVASKYFDLYRIDHIVGFYRVWAIPKGKKPKDGFFVPEDSSKWIKEGETRLKVLLGATKMLPIGEDLGSVPQDVRVNLQKLGISGTKVIRWERRWDESGQPFIPVTEYNRDSMTTVSTHDSETLSLWWTNQQKEVEAYCKFKGWNSPFQDRLPAVPLDIHHRFQILEESHRSKSIFHINLLQEYLALVPEMVHQDPTLERINVPATTGAENWSYRMKPFMEDMIASDILTKTIKRLPFE